MQGSTVSALCNWLIILVPIEFFLEDNPKMSRLVKLNLIKKVASDWKNIGYCLELPGYVLDNIEHDTVNFGCEQSSHETFRRWLNGEGRQPVTWRTLIEVLQDADRKTLAADLKQHINL